MSLNLNINFSNILPPSPRPKEDRPASARRPASAVSTPREFLLLANLPPLPDSRVNSSSNAQGQKKIGTAASALSNTCNRALSADPSSRELKTSSPRSYESKSMVSSFSSNSLDEFISQSPSLSPCPDSPLSGCSPEPYFDSLGPQAIKPSALKWSQPSISCCLSDKKTTVQSLATSLSTKGWDPNCAPLVAVRMPDDTLVSSDNRRLTAARIAESKNPDLTIPVEVYGWDEDTGLTVNQLVKPNLKQMNLDDVEILLDEAAKANSAFERTDPTRVDHIHEIGVKMCGLSPRGAFKTISRNGFGYKDFPNVVCMYDDDGKHADHPKKLNKKIAAVQLEILEQERQQQASPSTLLEKSSTLSSGQKRRLREKMRKAAESAGCGTPPLLRPAPLKPS